MSAQGYRRVAGHRDVVAGAGGSDLQRLTVPAASVKIRKPARSSPAYPGTSAAVATFVPGAFATGSQGTKA